MNIWVMHQDLMFSLEISAFVCQTERDAWGCSYYIRLGGRVHGTQTGACGVEMVFTGNAFHAIRLGGAGSTNSAGGWGIAHHWS